MRACELCAVYNASNAMSGSGEGWLLGVSEQFTTLGSEQVDGRSVHRKDPNSIHASITHVLLGYDVSEWVGFTLNAPMVHRSFRRTDFRYETRQRPALETESGSESGWGDVALISRVSILRRQTMKSSLHIHVLGGVKLPTGDTARLRDEVSQARIYNELLPPGTPHDPLGHSVGSVHQHHLSPGSGSVDGLFGLTTSARWRRWFLNAQYQYALRTQGASGFEYGDDQIVSGGPGRFLLAGEGLTLSLQGLASHETMGRDRILGRASSKTGMSVTYAGPQLNLLFGGGGAANLGVDIPVRSHARGFQVVPDYRIHGGITWRF